MTFRSVELDATPQVVIDGRRVFFDTTDDGPIHGEIVDVWDHLKLAIVRLDGAYKGEHTCGVPWSALRDEEDLERLLEPPGWS